MTIPNQNDDYDEDNNDRPFTPEEKKQLRNALLKTGAGVTTTVTSALAVAAFSQRVQNRRDTPRGDRSTEDLAALIGQLVASVTGLIGGLYMLGTGLYEGWSVLSAHGRGDGIAAATTAVTNVNTAAQEENHELESLLSVSR